MPGHRPKNKLTTIFKHILIFTALTTKLFAQDTTVVWLKNIDTTDYKIIYNKKAIPDVLLKYMQVDKLSQIANPGEEYVSGCVGPRDKPHKRLNWVAKDKNNHVVVSISVGGKAHRPRFFYIDKDKGKYNLNELMFGHSYIATNTLTFGSTSNKIKRREFEFLEVEPPLDE